MKIKYLVFTIMATTVVIVGFNFNHESKIAEGDYDFLIKRLYATKEFTVAVINAMPEEEFKFKPTKDVRSFGAQAFHIIYSVEWFIPKLKGQPIKWQPGDEERMNKKELIQYADQRFDSLITLIASSKVSNELTDTIIDLLNHNAHHRGQMTTYLRLKGLKPPNYR